MMRGPNSYTGVLCVCLAATILVLTLPPGDTAYSHTSSQLQTMTETAHPLEQIKKYISSSWEYLTRSLAICKTFEDIKTEGEPYLYLPLGFPEPADIVELQKYCPIRVARLPKKISSAGDIDLSEIPNEGVLFLPHPYGVPGGQFNEMYGWDSYFIILGLLRAKRFDLAQGMVENFFFEIEHYGSILNANRTYYLTRSQPPFLTSMILAVYDTPGPSPHRDLAWLEKAYKFAVTDYQQWTHPPHLAGDTGLSRYFDPGDGPVPEIIGDANNYYRGAAQYFLLLHGTSDPHLVHVDREHPPESQLGPLFPVRSCAEPPDHSSKNPPQENCSLGEQVALTADFYKGDRSMRESGFDVSFRFGPFSGETHHYAPVCLNSLLYKTEKDLERMSILLGRPQEAERWEARAIERQKLIQKYLWDAKQGLYFDYNFMTRTLSTYDYATTFYPLWAGLASPEQAQAVVKNLSLFEQPGGLAMSRAESQAQWDS